jgi:hypothetical protein
VFNPSAIARSIPSARPAVEFYPARPPLSKCLATALFLLFSNGCSPMAGLADRFVYFPTRDLDGGTPATIGLAYEDVALRTADGVRLHAWFGPGGAGRPTLLFLHGNAGNISHRLEKLSILNDLGVSVLLLDYRGYGLSRGEPSEAGTYRDADAAYDWLRARGIEPGSVVPYGESLGGGVATDLAARRPVGALILESTPTNMPDVARAHYPLLPAGLLLSVRYDALAKIPSVSAPLLLLHSSEDEIVPFAMAERLHRAARPPKRLVRLRGGHNDNFLVAKDAYVTALREFLATPEKPG